jgi:hypothetical protein
MQACILQGLGNGMLGSCGLWPHPMVSSLHNWSIEVHDINKQSVFTYAVESHTMNVVLAKSSDYYAIKMMDN